MVELVGINNIKRRSLFFSAALVMLLSVAASNLMFLATASAVEGQLGAQQVTLNPGGGVLADGSDGIRFTVNSDAVNTEDADYVDNEGSDAMVYQNTYQFCCDSGSGPQLNVGGTLYGQSGAAGDNSGIATWDSVVVSNLTGSAKAGARNSTTGSGSVKVTYTVVDSGRTYIMERVISYTYPNNYVTENYTFTLPSGSEVVKFYIGGDTAPGSSDEGYGAMLTSPVRSLISLNPYTAMQMGIREVASGRAFDYGYSRFYNDEYSTIEAGGNIGAAANDIGGPGGFYLETMDHDAGVMAQWNLGSTAGIYTGSLQQFVVKQDIDITAEYSDPVITSTDTSNLILTLDNDTADTAFAAGFDLDLPNGIWGLDGEESTTCDPTDFYVSEGVYVTVSGITLDPNESCTITIPVTGEDLGTYEFYPAVEGDYDGSLYNMTGGVNGDITSASLTITGVEPEFGTDRNGDGIFDDEQANVASIDQSAITGKIVVLEVDENCAIDTSGLEKEIAKADQDAGFDYPQGIMNFTVDCGDPGYETTVKQYYYDVDPTGLVMRKYNPSLKAYFTIEGATITTNSAYGHTATVGTYKVKDGGVLDLNGLEDGIIVDPAGPGIAKVGTPNTGLARR